MIGHAETWLEAILSEEMESAEFCRFGHEDGAMERNYLPDLPIYTTNSLRSFRHVKIMRWKLFELPTRVDIVRSLILMRCCLVQPSDT